MQWHDDSARFPRFQFLPPGEPPRRSHLFQGGDPTKVEGGMRGVPPESRRYSSKIIRLHTLLERPKEPREENHVSNFAHNNFS